MPIWYELMTPDPAAVAGFYEAVGGWTIPAEGSAMPTGSDYRMISRPDGGMLGGVLTISDDMRDNGARPGWLPYFHVADVDAAVAQVKSADGTVHLPPWDMPVGRLAMVSDPQGATFYLMDPKPPEHDPDAKSDVFAVNEPGHAAWNELNTEAAAAQEQFYTDLLGWKNCGEMPMPGEHTYRFVECEGVRIGAIGSMKPEGMPSQWLIYLRVPELAPAIQAVEANGGDVLHGPHEVPGGDRIIVARDPAGATIGIVGK